MLTDKKNVILRGLVGSHAYGLVTEDSDKDYMEVYVAPIEYYFGYLNTKGSYMKVTDEEDENSYEFLKFIRLASKFNPNVIPLLYLEHYEICKPLGNFLLDIADCFISCEAYHPLVGMAKTQFFKSQKGITGKLGANRKALIELYGYDVKAASHTIRMLKLAAYMFETGCIDLHAGKEISLDVKLGKYSVEEFENLYDSCLDNVDFFFETAHERLPLKVDHEELNKMVAKYFLDCIAL